MPRVFQTAFPATSLMSLPGAPGVSTSRLLQQSAATGLHRAFVTDDGFVAAEVSGDGGMNWEAAGSPAWGGKPALAMDADTVLAAVVVRDDSLFCNWWNGEGDWNWGDEKLVFSAPAGVEFGHPSVALYPGKVGGVKVAAVTLCVYDPFLGRSTVL